MLAAFEIERGDHIAYLRGALAAPRALDVNEVYRRIHSLKGAARACGLGALEELAESSETLVGRIREGKAQWTSEVVALLHRAVAAIEGSSGPESETPASVRVDVEAMLETGASGHDDLQERVRAAFAVEQAEHVEHIRAVLGRLGETGVPTDEEVADMFRRAHSLKGAARACGFPEVAEVAHRLEDLYAQVRDGETLLDTTAARRLLDRIEDGAVARATPPVAGARAGPEPDRGLETMRVSAERFDRVLDAAGQLLTECLQKDRAGDELRALHQQTEQILTAGELARRLIGERERRAPDPLLARAGRQLDALAAGARGLARRTRDAERRQRHSAWSLNRLGCDLQREVRQARMTPVSSVFQGLRKMVRDLARETGKQVDFRVTGLQVQADRMVLQALKDPIMHMVRNALSHGIEMPEDRTRAGKAEIGRLELRIEVHGNRLLVTVTDDGRGLDRTAIVAEAVGQGRLDAEQAAALSDEEVFGFIFQPGFSTTKAVTNLSGRGMGLSVVLEALTRLQGEVEVRAPAVGTCIALRAPLAVSTYRMLLVRCGGQEFALPFGGVERLLRVRAADVMEVDGRATIVHRGELLPLLSLGHQLGLETGPATDDFLSLVVLRANGRSCALSIDSVIGERDALLKDLDGPAANLRHLAGAILREDGTVSLVLQISELVASSAGRGAASATPNVVSDKTRTHRILVVDDSFTTRTLERSILETHGFDVDVAVDGMEALEKLRAGSYDMVISDIEMPRLDGFGLVREIKRSDRLAAVPVIIVTSLSRNEDRLRGLELGADAYIVKQRFDHEELLQTIGQILA